MLHKISFKKLGIIFSLLCAFCFPLFGQMKYDTTLYSKMRWREHRET